LCSWHPITIESDLRLHTEGPVILIRCQFVYGTRWSVQRSDIPYRVSVRLCPAHFGSSYISISIFWSSFSNKLRIHYWTRNAAEPHKF